MRSSPTVVGWTVGETTGNNKNEECESVYIFELLGRALSAD